MSAKVSAKAVSQVENQIPQFISDENPLYEKFLKNYYEFLETLCVYFTKVGSYTTTFTNGETVTGQTSGATASVKGRNSLSSTLKVFLEPTNDLNFLAEEVIIGGTSNARGTITKLNRKALNGTKTFTDLIDPDLTSEGILDWFKKELYPNIRNTASVDLRYFLKHLKEFYRSKGSEKSYRTLFRALYGQDSLDFYYPKSDMLKVSDGNWLQDTVLQLSYDVSYLEFNGLTITGNTSLATAFVQNVTTRKIGNVPVIELVVTTFVGTFTVSETITATTAEGTELSAILTGMLTDVTIVSGGEGYSVDEALTVTDATNVGFGGAAKVKSTTSDQVAVITVSDAGNGYQVNDPLTFNNTGTNAVVGAAAKVATLSDTFTVDVVSTLLTAAIETKTVDLSGAFGVEVTAGMHIGNNAIFANATKKGVVISYTTGSPNVLSYYDKDNETLQITLTCTTTSGSTSITTTNTSGLTAGQPVSGTGIPTGATVASVTNSTTFVLSTNASASGSASLIFNTVSTTPESLTAFANGDTLHLFNKSGVAVLGAFSVTINDTSFTTSTAHVALNSTNYGAGFASPNGTFTTSTNTITVTYSGGHNLQVNDTVKLDFSVGALNGTYTVATRASATVFTVTKSGASGSGTVEMIPIISSRMKNAFTFTTQTFGKVATVSYSSHGSGYETKPTATLTSLGYYSTVETRSDGAGGFYGSNATIAIGDLGGAVTGVTITEPGFGYELAPAVTGATHSTAATLTGILGITRIKDGKYSGEDGMPSSQKKVQDNDYYQDYSYVLKTTDSVNVWRNDVLKLLHPAGYKLFGEVLIENLLNTQMFDRANNNINTVNATGMSTYREVTFFFESFISGLQIDVGEALVEVEAQIDSLIAALESFAEISIKGGTSQTYLVNPLAATNGIPAEMFSTLVVKDVGSVSVGTTTTITTSSPHYFLENDLVSLDDFVGTNVSLINGNMYKATSVGSSGTSASNNTFVIKHLDGTTNVDTTGMSITTQGRTFKTGNRASSGILIDLFSADYIEGHKTKKVHEFLHTSPATLSGFSSGDQIDISGRHIDIESRMIQEDNASNDDFLLEDGTTDSPNSSQIGYLLADEGQLDLDGANDAHQLAVTEATQRQVSSVTNNILTFNRPIEYKGIPHTQHPHTQGFGLYKHKVDRRVLAA